MNFKLQILANKNTQNKNPLRGLIWGWYQKFVVETRYRISGSVTFSVVVHILFFIGYFSLLELDQPVEPPIREISFVDFTEPPPPPPEAIKKRAPRIRPEVILNQPPPPMEIQPEASVTSTSKPLALGNDRLFLDSPRKQAPINVEQVEPVGGDVNQSGDLLKVSQAIGIKNDELISKPAIDLSANSKVTLTARPSQGAVSISQSGKPQIDLDASKVSSPLAAGTQGATEIGQTPPTVQQKKPSLAPPRETQTTITGELADRKILKKVIPPFPQWAKRQGVGATIALQFTVMENGTVKENVIVARTSGSREWDKLVIESLKKWKFIALQKTGVRQDQTGVITFQFVI